MAPTHSLPPKGGATIIPGGKKDGLLAGITLVEEAWDTLEHHYGNREIIVAW